MVTRTPSGFAVPGLSALMLRHLEELYGTEPVPPAAVERVARQDHWFGILPRRDELSEEGIALAVRFRELTPELRGRLLALAVQGGVGAPSVVGTSALSSGFVEIAQPGEIRWMSDLHRIAVLAGADVDDHRAAGRGHDVDSASARGGALHLLFAGETVDLAGLAAAAEFFARADQPSWAVHCLIAAADSALTSEEAARLAATAANIAAFDGDFTVAQRVLARFTATDTRVLLRETAAARALRQALVEGDPTAARATVLGRLAEKGLDSQSAGEALAAYALANIIDANPAAWGDFVQACVAASEELHPDIVAIATTYGAPAPESVAQAGADAPAAADRRGWAQLAGCISAVLQAFGDLRLGSAAPPAELITPVDNRLVRLISASWVSVMLAHNLHWKELETTLAIAMDTTDTVPAPLMRINAETLLALLEAFRGESESARKRLERIRSEPAVRRAYRLRLVLDSVEAMIEGSHGNYETALALLSTRQPDIFYLTAGPSGPMELFDFVDYALQLHNDDEAALRVDRAREVLSPPHSERTVFILAACEAAIATRKTLAPAEELLARAQTLPFVYESARLRLVYAERLRRLNRTAEARRQLLRAEVELKTVQAGAWMDRLHRELRACRRGDVMHVGDLTEQESRIAELAAGGLSNKEIGARLHLSPRTVGGHLYKIYPKLGITTRAQLRDALATLKPDEAAAP